MTLKRLNTAYLFLILAAGMLSACQAERQKALEADLATSVARFFGQAAPGLTPEVFAPGVISLDGHTTGSITFSPDMTELFFQRRKPGESHNIYTMKLMDGQWSEPEPAIFSTNKQYLDFHPRFDPKGDRLYFGSTRPLSTDLDSAALAAWNGQSNYVKLHQWYIEKDEQGWGQPQLLLEDLFEGEWVMCVTPSKRGNLYFTSKEQGAKLADEGIYVAANQDGQYPSIERIGDGVNGYGTWIAHPFIDPEERYIIYDAERTAIKDNGDLYVSFNIDGEWSASYSLGAEINTDAGEQGATVSPDGKYLFYSGSVGDDQTTKLYWISTEVIKRWHPESATIPANNQAKERH